ncbi:MAG: hypothetical protein FJ000_10070 [Actinobacteria bacterium]|nr:hypothetical protein [Actinomycetota bacterium]
MDLHQSASHVLRSYVEDGRCGGDEERAVKTLHKHHPDAPLSVCRAELSN